MVERWFPDADTNTVLLLLEREEDQEARENNEVRFVRLRRLLAQLIPDPSSVERRGRVEELLELMLSSARTGDDPRMQVNLVRQGPDGCLEIGAAEDEDDLLEEEGE
jgi:hypothetical protein